MANPKIEVEISSNVDKLKKGFSDSEAKVIAFGDRIAKLKTKFDASNGSIDNLKNRLTQLKKNLEGATSIQSIAKYNIRIRDTEEELDRLSNVGLRAGNALKIIPASLAKTTLGVNQLTRSTSNYNGVGIEFSRIIQDAPFGIIGVGNNITRLAETFTQARNSGQSLTQILGGVLKGGNALVLGISLLTTAFTVLSQKGFFDSKEAALDAEEALENYRKSLDALRKSALDGEVSAQKEIQNFKLLKAQAENANVPLNKRIEAVGDLQKNFPEYLSNLTQEQILTGNVGNAYDKLTKSLLETAKARAASNIIIKNTEEVLTLQRQQLDNEQAIIDARDKVSRLEASAATSAATALRINGQFTAQNTDLIAAKEKLNELLEPQIERGNRINELTTINLQLNNEINTSLENGATFTKTTLDNAEKLKRVYEDINALPTTNALERFDQQTQGFEAPLTISSGKAETQGIIIPDKVFTDFENKSNKIIELSSQISGAFGGVGSAIAAAFGQKPAFGQFLGQFIAFAAKLISTNFSIATSNAIAGATSSAAATGPAAAFTLPAFIAAAVGLVGSAFAAFGGGKGSSGGGSIGAGTASQSFTGSGLGSTGLNLSGEFVVKGSDLVYVLERQTSKNAKG